MTFGDFPYVEADSGAGITLSTKISFCFFHFFIYLNEAHHGSSDMSSILFRDAPNYTTIIFDLSI